MKPNILNRFWLMCAALALAALACNGGTSPIEPLSTQQSQSQGQAPAQNDGNGLTQSERAQLISATVQIYGLFNDSGEFMTRYTGSGTLLNSSGMILTNAHVASPASQGDAENEPDALGIAIITSEDKPPLASYLAKVLAVDGYLDLAIIQITSTMDGSEIDPRSLNLPYVEMGDSNQTHVGDHVSIFGFPGIGGDTITFTEGSVSGFTSEDQLGNRAWIKTDATIAGGNSGGLAADDNARIIGVPTQASSGGSGEVTDCRQIQDTNGDGAVDKQDNCIPIGGFINALRPIELAKPLIQAAQAGKQYVSPYGDSGGVISEAGSGGETLSNFTWNNVLNSDCKAGEDVVQSYDADTLCIIPVFDYSGMTNGESFREVWTKNGEQIGDFTYAWEWDAEGRFASNLANKGNPMPEGVYGVEFFAGADSKKLGVAPEITVGSANEGNAPQPDSADTVTLYGVITDAATGNPIPNVYVFVLSSGVTYEKWKNSNWSQDYVEAELQAGANGKYRVTEIPRNVEFTIVFSADGYYDATGDNLQMYTDDVSPYEMNVELTK